MPKFLRSLFGQVVLALLVGVVIGLAWPDLAVKLKPLGDGFIKLIKMIIPVIVFCVVVHGIAGAGDLKRVGRVGVKALIYFEVLTTIALGLGLVLAFVFQPGVGMNVDPKALDAKAMSAYADTASKLTGGGTVEFLMRLIPTTVVDAFAKGDVLQVLLFAVLFGSALALLGERGQRVTGLVDDIAQALFKTMGILIKLAPLGVLGAIAFTVGKYGVGSLKQLGMLVVLFYAAVIIFVTVVLGGVMRLSGFSLWKLLRYLREELAIVFATTSSDSVLPQIMAKLRKMGIRDSTVGLVIPTGYSFNLDAFSIYITLAAVFIAQATNTPISMADLLTILAISLVTSKGAHGVPGSAIVVLAATLQAIPAIPAIGLVLVLSVDWFMGIARARQPDRQLRRDGRDRRLGGRYRPRTSACGSRRAPRRPDRRSGRRIGGRGGRARLTRSRRINEPPERAHDQPNRNRPACRRSHPGAKAQSRRTARRAGTGRSVRCQPDLGARGADAIAGARFRRGPFAQGLVRRRAVFRAGARRVRGAPRDRDRDAARGRQAAADRDPAAAPARRRGKRRDRRQRRGDAYLPARRLPCLPGRMPGPARAVRPAAQPDRAHHPGRLALPVVPRRAPVVRRPCTHRHGVGRR